MLHLELFLSGSGDMSAVSWVGRSRGFVIFFLFGLN